MVKWWGRAGFTIPLCEINLKVGGRYRTIMRESDGTDHIVTGVYQEVLSPHRLAFTSSSFSPLFEENNTSKPQCQSPGSFLRK